MTKMNALNGIVKFSGWKSDILSTETDRARLESPSIICNKNKYYSTNVVEDTKIIPPENNEDDQQS